MVVDIPPLRTTQWSGMSMTPLIKKVLRAVSDRDACFGCADGQAALEVLETMANWLSACPLKRAMQHTFRQHACVGKVYDMLDEAVFLGLGGAQGGLNNVGREPVGGVRGGQSGHQRDEQQGDGHVSSRHSSQPSSKVKPAMVRRGAGKTGDIEMRAHF
jgi:hypothetical protein